MVEKFSLNTLDRDKSETTRLYSETERAKVYCRTIGVLPFIQLPLNAINKSEKSEFDLNLTIRFRPIYSSVQPISFITGRALRSYFRSYQKSNEHCKRGIPDFGQFVRRRFKNANVGFSGENYFLRKYTHKSFTDL